jgi:hypothetical protein
LEAVEAVARQPGEDFGFEGAVEAFDLALGLGVVGSAVDDADVQAEESGLEPTDAGPR